jgi:hypothetical protein
VTGTIVAVEIDPTSQTSNSDVTIDPHPFRLWADQNFEFVVRRRNVAQAQVFFLLAHGKLTSVPTAWTNRAEPDPS